MQTARHREPALKLLGDAAGPPRVLALKLRRLARALSRVTSGRVVDARLARLERLGIVERRPTRVQLVTGGIDMLRFWISPAAADYYRSQRIDYGFHQLLRVLDDPASMVDPVGLASEADVIIGHLMQVVHANPLYDLQLLSAHEGGLDELERQLEQILAGAHPRQRSIGAIVEEPDYHARLLDVVRRFRVDPTGGVLLRANIVQSAHWSQLERTFGSLTTSFRYFCRLPRRPGAAARHLLTVREFPAELGEPSS